ncbi:MAG TPA: type III PLP-dependent enzyme [Jiangellaceae bacterium]
MPQLVHRRATRRQQAWPRRLEPSALQDLGFDTPFLVTDCEEVARRFDRFTQAMPGIRPHFALKCNAALPVLATLAGRGAGFEIASVYELEPLEAVGVPAHDVLFSNTVKPEPHIRAAVAQGVWRFALDSEGELHKLAAVAPGSAVYVRLDVEDSHSLFPLSRKFGTSADQALRLLSMAAALGLRPYGLTFHVGSQCTDPSMYARAIERCGLVMRRLEQFGTRIDMLNIGGGMPATYADPVPDIRAVGDAVGRALARLPYRPPHIVAEPGRYLVAESSVLVATVIGTAFRHGERWAYLDVGGFNGLMEAIQTGGRWLFPMRTCRSDDMDVPTASFNVTGPSCDSSDTMFYGVDLPETLETGDRIYIGSAGAYTLSYASNFNGFPPPQQVFV